MNFIESLLPCQPAKDKDSGLFSIPGSEMVRVSPAEVEPGHEMELRDALIRYLSHWEDPSSLQQLNLQDLIRSGIDHAGWG
jgi:hypothetical protein